MCKYIVTASIVEYYTATRTNKLLIFMSNMAESHKHNIKKKKGKKDYILHDFIYVNTRIQNPGKTKLWC